MNAFAFDDCMTLADHQVESAEFNGKLNQESNRRKWVVGIFSALLYITHLKGCEPHSNHKSKKSHNHN